MTGVGVAHLQAIYADSDDPWAFRTSRYEQDKFRATRAALAKDHYAAILEIGCGNGQLARHLCELCDRYTGVDAVDRALDAARAAVPAGRFVKGYYPCPLPDEDFDLIVLSEFLYFLNRDSIARLASEMADRWPAAEILCVSWLGPTDHELQGRDSVAAFTAAMQGHVFRCLAETDRYRIDRGLPKDRT